MRTSIIGLIHFFLLTTFAFAGHVEVTDSQLVVDGRPVSYLYGAEVQYFRARGGSERNVPRETVIKLWNKLLDRVAEAKMNTVIFYIPWDFHEPVEGTFDFDGKLSLDGDEIPDYPSRDLRTFLRMVESRGLKNIMIRPGPYINAEWGPTGFGAIPKWFLEKYPQALAKTQDPKKPTVASFHHPIYREKVEKWLKALLPIVKPYIGDNRPVAFLQIDNETNYFWDSVYERDWHPGAIARYRMFLEQTYGTIDQLNQVYGTKLASFNEVEGPRSPADKRYESGQWHYDWFHWHDYEIDDYYRFIRKTWENLGVNQPDVLFTSCDSFNTLKDGLLPRLDYRQAGRLSLTTMNVYPKTFGKQEESTLNTPMKAAHDAVLVAAAHRQFYGSASQWVMSTETVGGWFPPTEVSLATRQHTYGSLMGAGVKALIIYYFHEGWNWTGNEKADTELHFDAPLNKDMDPRPAFALLKSVGEALDSGLGDRLVASEPVTSPILIARDSRGQYPVSDKINVQKKTSDDAAALFGLIREAGYTPKIGFADHMTASELARFKVVIWDNSGYMSKQLKANLLEFEKNGGKLLFFSDETVDGFHPNTPLLPNLLAEPWNNDSYLKTKDAANRLLKVRAILQHLGVVPLVEVKAPGKNPFIHVSVRKSGNGHLVFVENFARHTQHAEIKIAGVSGNWTRIWGGYRVKFKGNPPRLPVTADAVDVWLVE